jgi:hypothetical protein
MEERQDMRVMTETRLMLSRLVERVINLDIVYNGVTMQAETRQWYVNEMTTSTNSVTRCTFIDKIAAKEAPFPAWQARVTMTKRDKATK